MEGRKASLNESSKENELLLLLSKEDDYPIFSPSRLVKNEKVIESLFGERRRRQEENNKNDDFQCEAIKARRRREEEEQRECSRGYRPAQHSLTLSISDCDEENEDACPPLLAEISEETSEENGSFFSNGFLSTDSESSSFPQGGKMQESSTLSDLSPIHSPPPSNPIHSTTSSPPPPPPRPPMESLSLSSSSSSSSIFMSPLTWGHSSSSSFFTNDDDQQQQQKQQQQQQKQHQHQRSNDKSSSSSFSSWNCLPVEMLDFDFVRQCQSAHQLRQIIHALSITNPPKYPSLLRVATSRLQLLIMPQNQHNPNNHPPSPPPPVQSSLHGEDTSLPFSFPTQQQQQQQQQHQQQHHLINAHHIDTFHDAKQDENEDEEEGVHPMNESSENFAAVLAAHSAIKNQLNQAREDCIHAMTERDHFRAKLKDQAKQFLIRVQTMEQHAEARSKYLTDAKQNAETAKTELEAQLAASSTNRAHIFKQLQTRDREIIRLKKTLDMEKLHRSRELRETKSLHHSLKKQIDLLTRQVKTHHYHMSKNNKNKLSLERHWKQKLTETAEQNRNTVTQLQIQLRKSKSDNHNIQALNQNFNTQLSTLRKERTRLQKSLEERSLDRKQYTKVLSELSASRSATKAMAKTVAKCESDLKTETERRQSSEQKCLQLAKDCSNLEERNKQLMERLEHFKQELDSSQKYIDLLLSERRTADNDRKERRPT